MLLSKSNILRKILVLSLSGIVCPLPTALIADSQPSNSALSHSQRAFTYLGNPAEMNMVIEESDRGVVSGATFQMGIGLEYGDVNNIFDRFDQLSNVFQSSEPELPSSEKDASGIDFDTVFEQFPEVEKRLGAIKTELEIISGLLAAIVIEGYAIADINSDNSFILNNNFYDGTLSMGINYSSSSKVLGIIDNFEFDSDLAKQKLVTLTNLADTAPARTLDFSGGISLYYNPATGDADLDIVNDSLLLVKSAKVSAFSLSYSRKAKSDSNGSLYWGVKPTFYQVGLTSVGARLGDFSDSEAIFDDIDTANYTYQTGFDIDLGIVWTSTRYRLGTTLTNLFEPDFEYPELDRRRFSSTKIIEKLNSHENYTMERQLRLEGRWFTANRHWNINVDLDAFSIKDIMNDEYQWLNISGEYAPSSWWFPNTRLGYSSNLAGTKLSYLSAGVTFMKYVNLDIFSTIDKVVIDDSELMRGLGLRLGFLVEY